MAPGAGVAHIQMIPALLQGETGAAQLVLEAVGGALVGAILGLHSGSGAPVQQGACERCACCGGAAVPRAPARLHDWVVAQVAILLLC